MSRFNRRVLLFAGVSVLLMYFFDYLVWVYFPISDVLDAGIIGLLSGLFVFVGMKYFAKR